MSRREPHECRDDPRRPETASRGPGNSYEKPRIRTLDRRDLLSAVEDGSKFPARGFAG